MFLLIENHCPIATASRACPDLCQDEMELWRSVIGPDVFVIRPNLPEAPKGNAEPSSSEG